MELTCDADALRRIREALLAADYRTAAVEKLLETPDVKRWRFDRRDVPRILRRTQGGTPLHTLFRLFVADLPVEADAFQRAVAPTTIDEWVAVGLVEIDGPSIRGRKRLYAIDDLYLALDSPGHLPADPRLQIMLPSPSSFRLDQITPRRPIGTALDIGTGCGYQALRAARHSRHVVATDLNPRAVELTRFNGVLNGFDVECLEGDGFAPVAGRTFDLVVCNPPFVVTPGETTMYRDSGLPGDQLCERLVREAPAHLNPGGYFAMVLNWVERTGEDWRKRLHGWVANAGCDAWVVLQGKSAPADYATTWMPDIDPAAEPQKYQQKFDEWLAFFARERVAAIHNGAIVLRRRPGPNWFRCDDVPQLHGDCGDAVVRAFEAFDYLVRTPPEELLATRFRPSPHLRQEQTWAPAEAGWQLTGTKLSLTQGLGYAGKLDARTTMLASRILPDRPLGQVFADLAREFNATPAEVTEAALPLVRDMVLQGMFWPVESA